MTNQLTQSPITEKPAGEIFEAAFTVAEAQKIIGVSRPTLIKLVSLGKLQAFKVGSHWRFKPADLRKFMDGKLTVNDKPNTSGGGSGNE